MTKSISSNPVASFICRMFSILMALGLCLTPALVSQPVLAGPPPGSTASTTFTSSSSTTPSGTTPVAPSPTVTTDKFDYQHGETAAITAAGFTPNSNVQVTVTGPDGTKTQWTVKADSSGAVNSSYTFGNGADGLFTAVLSNGTQSATTVFTDPAAILYPNANFKTELSRSGDNSNYKCVDDNLPGNDGNSTYVYDSGVWGIWKRDIYKFQDLPSSFSLTNPDTAAPNKPTPGSTTHTANVWSNNSNITMVWNSVTDNGLAASGPTVQIVTVAKATAPLSGDKVNFVVCSPTDPNVETRYTPVEGEQLHNDYSQYTITLTTDPNGNTWTRTTINGLQAGIFLKNAGLIHDARATQLYLVVTAGEAGPSGVKGYNYYWDSQPPTTLTSGTTVYSVLTDGSHTFGVNAEDNAGNKSTFGTSGPYLIDTKAPTLTKLVDGLAAKNGWYNLTDVGADNKLDVTLNANDTNGTTPVSGVNFITYKVGSAAQNTVTNSSTAGATGNGKSATQSVSFVISTAGGANQGGVTLTHSATDVAGNTGSSPAGASQTIYVDTQSPLLTKNLTGTMGNNGWYTSSTVGVTLNASDATSGVDNIQHTVNGGPTTTATNTTVVDPVSGAKSSTFSTGATVNTQGVNTISHVAYDVAGNSSANNPASATSPQNINIDSTSPLLTKNLTGTTGENGWYTSAVGVTLNASDATPGSGVDSINFRVNSGLTVGVINPTLVDTANLVKSSTFSTGTTISTEGVNTISHTAYDMAGNSSANNPSSAVSPQNVSIDTVKPTLTKTINGAAPRDNSVNNGWYNAADAPTGTLTVALNASDATSGVQNISYTRYGGAATTVANPTISGASASTTQTANLNISKQGTTALTHQTKDMAGNTYVLTAQDVKLDTILPTLVKGLQRTGLDQVTVTLNGADDTSGSGINNIVYSADGGTAVTVLGGGAYTRNTTFVITGTGSHDLTHSIMDVAGNQYTLAAQSVAIGGQTTNTSALVPNSAISVLTVSLQGGTITSHPVTSSGMLISDADVTSPDGLVIASIPAGTTVLNKDGTPAYLNKDPDIFSIAAANSNAPAGYQMISSYELSPSGVTFDSPITLAINYDPAKLPRGTQPVIAFFDEGANKWVDLETAGFIAADGETAPHTAAARVSHFTRFAVLAK